MRQLTFLIIIFLVVKNYSFCQTSLKPGYIVTKGNDTIHGFINLKNNITNSKNCYFKEKKESEYKIYCPNDLNSYIVKDEKYYITKKINGEYIFLEYLVDGITNLYYQRSKLGDHYFIEKDSIIELTDISNSEEYYKGNFIRKKSNRYKGILKYVFYDNKEILPKIDSMSFLYKDLIDITKQYHYNVCNDSSCITYRRESLYKGRFGFSGIQSYTWLSHKNAKGSDLSIDPSFGIYYRFIPIKSYYRWNFIIGAYRINNHFNKIYTSQFYFTRELNILIKYDFKLLRFPVILEYSFPTKFKIVPNIRFGMDLSRLYPVNYQASIVYTDGHPPILLVDFINKQFLIGSIFSIGFSYPLYKNICLYLQSEYNFRKQVNNRIDFIDYNLFNSLNFNIGIEF